MHCLPRILPGLLFAVAALGAGCGPSTSSYTPQASLASGALTISLDAWKNDGPAEPAGKLSSGAAVRAVDSDWSSGNKLASYEVLRELPAEAEGPRKFAVKLKFADGTTVDEATYFIFGIDPVQVFRDKDYEKYFGMGK